MIPQCVAWSHFRPPRISLRSIRAAFLQIFQGSPDRAQRNPGRQYPHCLTPRRQGWSATVATELQGAPISSQWLFTTGKGMRLLTILICYVPASARHNAAGRLSSTPSSSCRTICIPHGILPPGDADYSNRWRLIKSRFTRASGKSGQSVSRHANGECALWQRRFWEHTILDARDLQCHVDYIHYNPVKHGYVPAVADWPYSSFHRYVNQGLLSNNWAGNGGIQDGVFGE